MLWSCTPSVTYNNKVLYNYASKHNYMINIDDLRSKIWSGAKLRTAFNYPIILGLHRYIVRQEYRALYYHHDDKSVY